MLSPLIYFKVKGDSMKPSFKEGEKIWVNRWAYLFLKPKKGDVVVLKHPNKNLLVLKRIKEIDEDKYFVVGDNLKKSTDSRTFGLIEKSQIIGRALRM